MNETVDHNDGVHYPYWETYHSELSNALGRATPHRPELDRTDQACTDPSYQASSRGHPSYPFEVVFSAPRFTCGASCKPNTGASQESQEPVHPDVYHLGNPACADSTSTTVQYSPLVGHRRNGSTGLTTPPHTDNTHHPFYDFSRTLQFHALPRAPSPTFNFTGPGAGNLTDPWATIAQVQDTSRVTEPESHQAEELPVERSQEAGQDSGLPSFQTLSSLTMEPPSSTITPSTTQCHPDDPAQIYKHLRRGVSGTATCAWVHGGGECGYSSHVDLVKRHIKRVHYRLK